MRKRRPHRARRLLTVPAERETPREFLTLLRAVSPTLECIYFGNGQWFIGEVAFNTARVHEGRKMLRHAATWNRRRSAELMVAGFSILHVVTGREPGSEDVQIVARRLQVSDVELERRFTEGLLVAMGVPQHVERIRLYHEWRLAKDGARDIHKHTVRGRPTVSVNGFKAGRA